MTYQYHHKRSEAWTIIDGIARITIDDITNDFQKGDTILIPKLSKHRVENMSNKFKKHDLIGVPYQIIIGSKSEGNDFEFKELKSKSEILSLDKIKSKLKT